MVLGPRFENARTQMMALENKRSDTLWRDGDETFAP
jgi:hypothetical protein